MRTRGYKYWFTILSIFLFLSCSQNIEPLLFEAPSLHPFTGKWISTKIKSDPIHYELAFETNGLVSLSTFSGDKLVDKEFYSYTTVNPETVEFYYKVSILDQRISVRATLDKEKPGSAAINCFLTLDPDESPILDQPRFCFYHDFNRVR